MKQLKFRMAATTDCGGRPNKPNEDNFQADDDLSDGLWQWVVNKECLLMPKGALLVVSDGMGGMNAGDRASALTIDTVKEFFASDRLTDDIIKSQKSIYAYMEKTIVEADRRIKEEGNANPEKEGMGATIVLAWFINNIVHIAWCGDSRAYLYNPICGLRQISKDHSYVQDLVDSGMLKPELAFDHPNNNIITRSLGDPSKTAKPDFISESLCNNDIILICSDGLHGVLRDAEIEQIIAEHTDNISECQNALLEAAKNADWSDNTTVNLLQVLDGADDRKPMSSSNYLSENSNDFSKTADELSKSFYKKANSKLNKNVKRKNRFIFALILLLLLVVATFLYFIFGGKSNIISSPKFDPNTLTFDLSNKNDTQMVKVSLTDYSWNCKIEDRYKDWFSCKKENDSILSIAVKRSSNTQNTTDSIILLVYDEKNSKNVDTVFIKIVGKIELDTASDGNVDESEKSSVIPENSSKIQKSDTSLIFGPEVKNDNKLTPVQAPEVIIKKLPSDTLGEESKNTEHNNSKN